MNIYMKTQSDFYKHLNRVVLACVTILLLNACSPTENISSSIVEIDSEFVGDPDIVFFLNSTGDSFIFAPNDNPTIISYSLSGDILRFVGDTDDCGIFTVSSSESIDQGLIDSGGITHVSSSNKLFYALFCKGARNVSGALHISYRLKGITYEGSKSFVLPSAVT